MLNRASLVFMAVLAMAAVDARAAAPAGDATRGAQSFGACAACHSLVPGRNMTGPSLAGVWHRKAGSLESFERYSRALKASGIVWDAKTLDAWLQSPARLVPDNFMTFAGIPDAGRRADLIAFLKEASAGHIPGGAASRGGGMMGGMTPQFQDLKTLGAAHQVQGIRYCRDSYYVTTADGKSAVFWSRSLRFKTDASDDGPLAGKPVIMPAGMMGDRASVIFASPQEISTFIKPQC